MTEPREQTVERAESVQVIVNEQNAERPIARGAAGGGCLVFGDSFFSAGGSEGERRAGANMAQETTAGFH
jgi:hypothetical protein